MDSDIFCIVIGCKLQENGAEKKFLAYKIRRERNIVPRPDPFVVDLRSSTDSDSTSFSRVEIVLQSKDNNKLNFVNHFI